MNDEHRSRSVPATPVRPATPAWPPRMPESSARLSSPPEKTGRTPAGSGRQSQENERPKGLGQGQGDNLLVMRSREAKGKERAVINSPLLYASSTPVPPPRSASSNKPFSSANIYAPQRRPSSRPVIQHPFSRQVIGDDTGFVVAGPSSSASWFSPRGNRQPSVFGSESLNSPAPSIPPERRRFIPRRSSSLRHSSASPTSTVFSSRRSSRRLKSPERPRKESIQETDESISSDGQAAAGVVERSSGNLTSKDDASSRPLELDEDDKVVRRIKQLRAAMEERDRKHLVDIPPLRSGASRDSSPEKHSSSLTRDSLPDARRLPDIFTTDANMNGVMPRYDSEEDDTRLYSRTNSFNNMEPKVNTTAHETPNFSRPKATFLSSPSASRSQLSIENSSIQHSPAASRSSSRAKRWSSPDMVGNESPHRRELSRNRTSFQQYPPLIEERRTSIDSVKEAVEEFLQSPRLSQKIPALENNRIISFAEVGDPNGYAVFCCVGMGLTRFVMAFYEELATTLKLRLITPERPGVGESTAHETQKAPLYWPGMCDSLEELA